MIAELTLLEEIKKDLPSSIQIEIDWDVNAGYRREEDTVIEAKEFVIEYDYTIMALSGRDSGDYITPPSMWIKQQDIAVSNLVVYDNGGDELTLTGKERQEICNAISNLISID